MLELFCEMSMMSSSVVVIRQSATISRRRELSLTNTSGWRTTQKNSEQKLRTKLSAAFFLAEFERPVYAMSESDRSATTSVECISAELATPMLSCSDPTRRALLLTALATGAYMASSRSAAAAAADEDQPGSDERPQKADVLVFS